MSYFFSLAELSGVKISENANETLFSDHIKEVSAYSSIEDDKSAHHISEGYTDRNSDLGEDINIMDYEFTSANISNRVPDKRIRFERATDDEIELRKNETTVNIKDEHNYDVAEIAKEIEIKNIEPVAPSQYPDILSVHQDKIKINPVQHKVFEPYETGSKEIGISEFVTISEESNLENVEDRESKQTDNGDLESVVNDTIVENFQENRSGINDFNIESVTTHLDLSYDYTKDLEVQNQDFDNFRSLDPLKSPNSENIFMPKLDITSFNLPKVDVEQSSDTQITVEIGNINIDLVKEVEYKPRTKKNTIKRTNRNANRRSKKLNFRHIRRFLK